jgi:hypothetical protein
MKEINLNIDLNELRSIYYESDSQIHFFGPNTKKQSLYLVISVFVYPFFAWYSINKKKSNSLMQSTQHVSVKRLVLVLDL